MPGKITSVSTRNPNSAAGVHVDPSGTGPLNEQQLQLIERARLDQRGFQRAIRLAQFNVWMLVIGAFLTLLSSLNLSGAVAAFAVAGAAWNEERGRLSLAQLEAKGAIILCQNQLIVLGAVVLYCSVSLISLATGPDPYQELMAKAPELAFELEQSPGAAAMASPIGELARTLGMVMYAVVLAVSALVQGLSARYYRRTARRVERFHKTTPAWVVEVLLRGA